MDVVFAYRGRRVTARDLEHVRALIAAHPQASRRALSQHLCAAWQWVQPNGHPRDMVCRGLMLGLHRAGLIALPPRRRRPPNPLARRCRPRAVEIDRTPVRTRLDALGALDVVPVRRNCSPCPVWTGVIGMSTLARDAGAATERGARRAV